MIPTTKDRPAATGRPLKPESGGNRSQTDDAPMKGHDMYTHQGNYATAEVRSTTGTAPIKFQRTDGNGVLVQLEDGSTQLYDRRSLMLAALGLWSDDGIPAAVVAIHVGAVLGDATELFEDTLTQRVTWSGGPDDGEGR